MDIRKFIEEIDYSRRYLKDVLSQSDQSSSFGVNNLIESIDYIEMGLVSNPRLLHDIIEPKKAKIGDAPNIKFYDPYIDETQGLAVRKALAMDNILVVQGPPGAGKSTTIVEMIRQLKNKNPKAKFIVTSQTHVAVDSVLEKLDKNGFKNLVRVAARNENNERLKQYYFKNVFLDYYRNSSENVKSLLNSYEIDETLFFENNEKQRTNAFLKESLSKMLLNKDVIGVTSNSLKRTKLSVSNTVDYVIVDEAGKLTFAEFLYIVRFARKLIIIGDPNQLPAFVSPLEGNYDKEAYRHQTDDPFINHLFAEINPECKVFLNTQYRMAKQIGNYISDCFYDFGTDKLKNGKTNKNNESALNFIDYENDNCVIGAPVSMEDTTATLANEYEVEIIKVLLDDLMNRGFDLFNDVAIISPYSSQIKLIKSTFPTLRQQNIDTVDAFQGREAKVVIFSCSRNVHVTQFFKKPNRINVAISRAIDEVWIISKRSFIEEVSYFKKLVNYNKIDPDGTRSYCNIYKFDNSIIKKV